MKNTAKCRVSGAGYEMFCVNGLCEGRSFTCCDAGAKAKVTRRHKGRR